MSKFGAKFKLKNSNFLPLKIYGSSKLKSIKYNENRGSAQCKSSIILQQWELMEQQQLEQKNQEIILSYYVNIWNYQ